MAKAGKTSVFDPRDARAAIKKHLQRLQNSSNGVQFEAQRHEVDMVNLLVDLAQDESNPATLRRQCALDVVTLARGVPKPWLHTGEDLNADTPGNAGLGATVGQELEAAKQTSALDEQLAQLTARNVHPRDWPENVRSVAADMIAYYENEEANTITP